MNMERTKEALEVFCDLGKLVPRETPVHIMIGKCYKILGNKELALKSFNRALALDPKDTNHVKCLIDKID
jgi:anaphase-promoting complex subunit 3